MLALKRKRGNYQPGFTLETEIFFDDFSYAVEENYNKFVLKICQWMEAHMHIMHSYIDSLQSQLIPMIILLLSLIDVHSIIIANFNY